MGWVSSLFESSYKKKLNETLEVARKQKEMFEREMEDIDSMHASQIRSTNSAISDSYSRLESLIRRNDAERSARLQEIDNDAEIHQTRLDEEMERFKNRTAEIESHAKEQLAIINQNITLEKTELEIVHNEIMDQKKKELGELKSSHFKTMKDYEKKKEDFVKKREDEILEFNKNMEKFNTDHFELMKDEMDKLRQIKLKNLDEEKEMLKLELNEKRAQNSQLFQIQCAQVIGDNKREVSNAINNILPSLKSLIIALTELQHSISESAGRDEETSPDLIEKVKYDIDEWKHSIIAMKTSMSSLKRTLKFYSPRDKNVRTKINSTVISIETNFMNTSSLPLNIKSAVEKNNAKKLQIARKSVAEQLDFLRNVFDELIKMVAPQDQTMELLEDRKNQESAKNTQRMLEN